jgi:MSHA type pilus biogenesis protein MshL
VREGQPRPVLSICRHRTSLLLLSLSLLLAGCVPQAVIQPSQGHIEQPGVSASKADIPPLVKAIPYLPPPRAEKREPTYTIVVDNVPVKDLLFSLARDTKQNIDISPGISGNVTLNAVNETLPAILERVARQSNIRYRMEGNTLSIVPDTPYLKTYKVNYVNLSRNTTSSIGVAAQIASTGSGTVDGAGSSVQTGNSSSTTVDSKSNNNFWDVLTDNVRAILTSTRAASQRAEDKSVRQEAERSARAERLEQAQAVARAGAASTTLFQAAFGNISSTLNQDSKNDVIVNPVAGTVSVLGSERQQQVVQRYLDGVSQASQRQVLIEATIVEVNLKDQYRAGIDWQRLVQSGGTGVFFNSQNGAITNLANSLLPVFNIGYKAQNFTTTLNLLESFGNLRVLSSPKLMALNNQTALLKVVDNLVYFSVQAQQGTLSSTGTPLQPTTFTTTAKTVPVGLVMSLTPQISENGTVTLDVRPTISRKIGDVSDPNPSLQNKDNPSLTIQNKIPVIQVREMESVLQVSSGQTVILGGLMQDDSNRARDGIPVLSRAEGFGAIFGQQERNVQKTELVIFLRPTVITNPSLDSDELKFYKRYLPRADGTTEQWHNGMDAAGDPR